MSAALAARLGPVVEELQPATVDPPEQPRRLRGRLTWLLPPRWPARPPMKELRAALRNSAIRRVVVAFATFNFAEWATWTAVLVYAFQRGGATESGLIAFTMVAPAAVVAPIVASSAAASAGSGSCCWDTSSRPS